MSSDAKRPAGVRGLKTGEMLAKLRGARLVYGKPVKAGGRTVIPVAGVSLAGGGGYGDEDRSGGFGGSLKGRPVGFIELTEEKARFRRIWTADSLVRAAAALLLAGLFVERRLRG